MINTKHLAKGLKGIGNGFVCAQFFPTSEFVRILIADTGIGIHRALTTHPKSKFKELSEEQAVHRSIEKGVTNSEGMGFGLWATSQMIKENRGELSIHSGSFCLNVGNTTNTFKTSKWNGTYTFLKINTNIPVNHKSIFGESSDQEDMFNEYSEDLFGNQKNLW